MISLLAAGGLLEQLGINPVVLATQVVVFVITFLLLSRILFGRALTQLQQREDEIQKGRDAVQRDLAEVERMLKEYEAAIAKVDKEGYDRTQDILREAISAAQASIARAQAEAKELSDKALAEIASSKKDTLVQLRSDVTKLTLDLVEKVMDTRLDPAVHGPAIQKYIQERARA